MKLDLCNGSRDLGSYQAGLQRKVPCGCLQGGFTEFSTQDRDLSCCGRFCVNIISKTQMITCCLHRDTVKQTEKIENQRSERSSQLSSLGLEVKP